MKSLERAETTKAFGRAVGIGLVLVCLLVSFSAVAQQQPLSTVPGVPNVVNPNENNFQRATHFLTFLGSFKPESANSARAYYKAIDPNNTKPTFADWLVNAGFIGDRSQWHPYGPQTIITSQPGCSGTHTCTYGDNIINADSHVVVLNAADLGFVRYQFIRCIPNCNPSSNPKVYTYLENYPVAGFASPANGGTSGFPFQTGYPTQAEATRAINSAVTRPLGTIDGKPDCLKATNPNAVRDCVERIADVAFEWAPPASSPTSKTRFGQLYAYIFAHEGADSSGNPITVETTDFPPVDDFGDQLNGAPIINFVAGDGSTIPIVVSPPNPTGPTDKFAPNLDFVGFKQHPGVCLMCHGGKPAKLTSTGAYPSGGNINEFRFLPLDVRNLIFTDDGGPSTLANQQLQLKAYNQEVLLTVPTYKENDGTGATRVPSIREVITGWYSVGGNYSNDTSMASPTQNPDWIPTGWRDVTHGGPAPVGAEDVYVNVVGPSCRSCHFNRELSLDFGTYANFHQGSDLPAIGLIAQCKQPPTDQPDKGARYMPAALLTFVRFWETQSGPQTLGDGSILNHEVDRLAQDFGFPGGVAAYCATNP